MKKLLVSLVTLCLAFCGITAMAAVGDVLTKVADLSTSKVYVLTADRGTLAAGDGGFVRNEKATTFTNTAEQFAFVKPSDNASNYYIYSVSKKRFIGIDNTWATVFADNGTFTISSTGSTTESTFLLNASNGNHVNINNERAVVIDWWGTADGGNSFSFTEAGDLDTDAQTVINNLLANYSDTELAAIVNTVNAYSNAGCTETAYTTFKSTYDTEKTSAESDMANWTSVNLKAAYTTFLPQRSAVFTGEQKVVLGNKEHTTRYVYYKTTSSKWGSSGSYLGSGESIDSPVYLWTVKKQTDGTVKIYNEYAGKWLAGNPGTNDHEYKMVDDEASATGYTAISDGTYICFVDLTYSDLSLAALHMVGWDGVVRWAVTADASKFKVITDLSSYLSSWTANLTDQINEYVGDVAPSNNLTIAQTTLRESTVDNYVTAYKALETAIADANTVTPETDAYYTIEVARCDNASSYIGHILAEGYNDTENTSGSNALIHEKTPANIVPALWQFEATGTSGQYNIKAVNSGSYLSKTGGASTFLSLVASDSDNKGTYAYGKSSVDVAHAVSLKDVSASSNTLISVRNEDEHVVSWDAGNDGSGNNFKIKAVTEIPVTISDAGYATLNLPFAVTIPTGVEAYTGTKGDGVITLTPLTSIIAANQPVILVAEAGKTYQFEITTSNGATTEASGLTGTLTPVTIGAKETAYILKNGTNGIGMYKITSDDNRTIPANKAYVAGGTDGNANVLVFNFGETTGIHSAATSANGKADTYYDLNGRQVLYPAHGVFVKGNGQKVFIK